MTSRWRALAPTWWAVAGVVLMAATLRPGATSVGPVLAELRDALGFDTTVAGVLTALPGFAFAAFGAVAVWLAVRAGLTRALLWAAIATTAGLLGRTFVSDTVGFLAFTVVALGGMGVGNVLIPSFIKRHFPARTASMTALYTTMLAAGATVGSLVAAPIAATVTGGWRASLGAWGLVGLVAIVPWAVMTLGERRTVTPDLRARAAAPTSLLRSRHAVALAVFFGVQSMQAYVQFGWAPQIYRDAGLDAATAGAMASIIAGLGIVEGLVMPGIVTRMTDARPLTVVFFVLLVAGYLGLWLIPATLPWLWAVLLGLSGAAFPTAIFLMSARTRHHTVTARVSGFTQSVGYLFAGAGPFIVGAAHAASGGWAVPLWFLLASGVVMLVTGWIAAAPGFVDDELGLDASAD